MKELSDEMLEQIDGGDWTTVYNVAKGGLEAGLGLAAGVAGAATLDPALAGAGAAALADGIYDIGTSGAF
ncbi:bacteriocin [Clostridium butyricum]|nr:bacteriocin [Clostridium butyricum]MDU0321875.1 bacteriocin [Clostridium butyricum]